MAHVDRKDPRRAKSSESDYSLMEFTREFPNDDTCLEWLWRERFSEDGKHADCPKCKREHVPFKKYVMKQRRQTWTCTKCGHHIQPTAGTIFHKSSTSLHLWFFACHLMTSTRCGISAKQLERELGVTYKTAHRMFKKIRTELMTDEGDEPLSGDVEIDETSWGGGAYKKVSPRYLQSYLNEYAWRHNHRNNERAMFELLLLRAASKP